MRWILILLLLTSWSCAHRQRTISSRPPGLFDKDKGKALSVRGRPIGTATRNPEIFVKQNDIYIAPADPENTTGSLYNVEDGRNNLFATAAPLNVGRFLTIYIASNRVGEGQPLASSEDSSEESKDAKAKKGGDNGAKEDDVEKELLSALPKLEPGDPGYAKLIKFFKAKIVHRYDNGDAQVLAERRSSSEEEANQIVVRARVPYEKLITGEDILTSDLLAVHWAESYEGQLIERFSSSWEDEYTMRLSGFTEARSRIAMTLDDKTKQLKQVKKRLEDRIQSFGAERRTFAKQREELFEASKKEQEKVKTLQETIDDQKQKLKDAEDQLLELRPDEKPGDIRDGASGG